jgi:SpoVK/Ycf46/Vps4 family AAA+-type ATPase
VAILRVFEVVDRFNRKPAKPVVLYGPSRSGKTELARLIHNSSARRDKPFLPLSASMVNVSDESLRLSRWAGIGTNAGVAGADPKRASPGWLP